jgi:UDP-glucose 4-epimerase
MASRARPRVLITGASGFLGRAFVTRFADRYEFIALGRTPPGSRSASRATWVKADLRAPLPLSRLPARIDAVAHLASLRSPSPDHGVEELFAVNAGSVAALFEYARQAGARCFVLGSTGGVCGYHTRAITEATPAAPFDAYTLSKWHGETIARHEERTGAVPVTIVRYFFPYGPGQTAGIMSRLAERIVSGAPVTLHARGRHPRLNPVFVDDACELTRRAIDARASLTVNCAGPQVATIRQIATMMADRCGTVPRFEHSPDTAVSNMVGSNRVAQRVLGFVPRVTLRAGLAALLDCR